MIEVEVKRFRGFLHDLDIRELLQICTVNRVTGRVLVEGEGKGEIYLQRGEIVHATCGELEGVEGLKEILRWGGGKVKLEPGVSPPEVTIADPWEGLLMETLAPREGERGEVPPAPEAPPHLALYSKVMKWKEVEECLLLDGGGEVLRPPSLPEGTRQRAKLLFGLWKQGEGLVQSEEVRPLFLSVLLSGVHWMVVPVVSHLLLLRVPRALNLRDFLARVNRVLGELQGKP